MRVVIAGGSGFLGSLLAARLRADGHQITILTRRPRGAGDILWEPSVPAGAWVYSVERCDAVVNLAGESLASGRWTAPRKAGIRRSRIDSTRALASAIVRAQPPPRVFLSASAVGIYGPRGDEPLTEESAAGEGFLASVCNDWEREAQQATSQTRVVLLRSGVVFDRDGGALPQMALPFRFGVGGPVGSGRQYLSWIHRDDWVEMARWALLTEGISGPLNLTAPSPATNREFSHTLGHALRRPSFLPAPAFALRLLLGEMADALLLEGQRVLPAKAERLGFTFQHPLLEPALRDIFGRPSPSG
jgi:uncharacterized protein (TIGR01777 family)